MESVKFEHVYKCEICEIIVLALYAGRGRGKDYFHAGLITNAPFCSVVRHGTLVRDLPPSNSNLWNLWICII